MFAVVIFGQHYICNALLSRKDSTTLFTLLRENDTLLVQSKNYNVLTIYNMEKKKEKGNRKKQLYKWVNDSVAYLNLTSITVDNFDNNYDPIKKSSVIILDLRCYPQIDVLWQLTNAFVPAHSFFAYVTYADAHFPGMIRYKKSTTNAIGNEKCFDGRVILLINELTSSFSEYVAMLLQANPKTITIGNSSSGADGNVSYFEFPGGIKILYSGIGIYYLDFTPTQRVGVKLNYIVEPTIESIKEGIDNAYEKAVSIAMRIES